MWGAASGELRPLTRIRVTVASDYAHDPFDALVEETASVGADLLLMGGKGGVHDRADCSVLMVRRYLPERWTVRVSDAARRLRDRMGLTRSPEA